MFEKSSYGVFSDGGGATGHCGERQPDTDGKDVLYHEDTGSSRQQERLPF